MQGFFFKEESKKDISVKAKSIRNKRAVKKQKSKDPCELCGLYKTCITPKMEYSGLGKKKILVIAEAPGRTEDEKGTQLIGSAGILLREKLKKFKIDLDKDCWKTNAVICRPSSNRTPSNKEIKLCRLNLFQVINELKPEKIIILGKVALQSYLGHRTSVTSITKWIGWQIPDQENKVWIFPTYHPSFILRDQENKVLNMIFEDHLKIAIKWDKDFPDYSNEENKVTRLTDLIAVKDFLRYILLEKHVISIDYETTGIKPHVRGHQIICMSISIGEDEALSFPMFDDDEFKDLLKQVLTDPKILKIAQNLKFEDMWTREILGYDIEGWHWDTMLTSHVLDNRSGIIGLKFQTFVNFGVLGYDDYVIKYMKSKDDDKGSNAFNDLKDCPQDELLLYCGMDTMFTYRLYRIQNEKFKMKTDEGNLLLLRGIQELSKVESKGIYIDENYYHIKDVLLCNEIKELKYIINSSQEAKLWEDKKGTKFNFNSNIQLKELLFNILDETSTKKTKKGAPSTDQEALEKINRKFVKDILNHRKLEKIKNTYLSNFIKETTNKYLHPNFNLHTTKTYRSSSSKPNFQNIPKRNMIAQEITRGGIIPRPGRQIMEVDYSGVEVRISTCYHKDPEMIKYIEDPTTDMHRDQAIEIFMKDDINKEQRYLSKNNFVFPQFYGDYYVHCAENLWNKMSKDDKQHLKTKGIRSYRSFENHIKNVEDKFWNKKFKVYTKWKRKAWNNYQEKGYIDSLTGFRCSVLMKKNDVLNYPIQGAAFHCLLWSLTRLNKLIRRRGFKSLIIGQIHDSIIFDIVPEEKEELKPLIRKIMCDDIRKYWDWIIVPLDIEAEITEVDGNWFIKKEEEI